MIEGNFTIEDMAKLSHQMTVRGLRRFRTDVPEYRPKGSGYVDVSFQKMGTPSAWRTVPQSIQKSIFNGGLMLAAHVPNLPSWLNGRSTINIIDYVWMMDATTYCWLRLPEYVRVYPVTPKSQRWGLNPEIGNNLYVSKNDARSMHEVAEELSPGCFEPWAALKGTERERAVFRTVDLIRILGTMGLLDRSNNGSSTGWKQRWTNGELYTDELFHLWVMQFAKTQQLGRIQIGNVREQPNFKLKDVHGIDIRTTAVRQGEDPPHPWLTAIADERLQEEEE